MVSNQTTVDVDPKVKYEEVWVTIMVYRATSCRKNMCCRRKGRRGCLRRFVKWLILDLKSSHMGAFHQRYCSTKAPFRDIMHEK